MGYTSIMEMSGKLHAQATLPPGKSLRYPFHRGLDGPGSRVGRSGEENTYHVITIHRCEVTADTENTASSIFACWTVFTELLPGNVVIESVTIPSTCIIASNISCASDF
jgi:hypothetical protein